MAGTIQGVHELGSRPPQRGPQAPFRAGGALRPSDRPFANVYSSMERVIVRSLVRRSPAVICSPRLTGRSTLVNVIESEQRGVTGQPTDVVRLVLDDKGKRRITESVFLRRLSAALGSRGDTIRDHIDSSKRLTGSTLPTSVVIENAEALTPSALRWLLASVKGMTEDLREKPLRTQLIIEGRFGLETLTSGPDSAFPLPQMYPSEFSLEEQSAFIRTRMEACGKCCTEESLKALWLLTGGDKYVTQAIALELWALPEQRIAAGSVEEAAGRLTVGESQDELFHEMSYGLAALNLRADDEPRTGLDELAQNWKGISPIVRATAYQFGLVLRAPKQQVRPRAPVLTSHFRRAALESRRVTDLISVALPDIGVGDSHQRELQNSKRHIVAASWRGALTSLHVGTAQRNERGEVLVNARSMPFGSYEAIMELEPRLLFGRDQAWILLWSWRTPSGVRSELQTFPVAPRHMES